MPTTRRSTRSSTGAGKQSTLSFKHKVTKAIQTGKEGYKSPSRAKEYIPEPTPEPTTSKAAAATKTDDDDDEQPLTPTTPTPTDTADDEKSHTTLAAHTKAAPQPTAAPDKTDAELKAAKITDKAIERYWSDIEASRSARAVHKKHGEGLTTGEKVLRYFDVSSQYGVRNNSFFFLRLSIHSFFRFACVWLGLFCRRGSVG